MKTLAAGSFKVHCLDVMDEVQAQRHSRNQNTCHGLPGRAPHGQDARGTMPVARNLRASRRISGLVAKRETGREKLAPDTSPQVE
jgi:hypothetical protein